MGIVYLAIKSAFLYRRIELLVRNYDPTKNSHIIIYAIVNADMELYYTFEKEVKRLFGRMCPLAIVRETMEEGKRIEDVRIKDVI